MLGDAPALDLSGVLEAARPEGEFAKSSKGSGARSSLPKYTITGW